MPPGAEPLPPGRPSRATDPALRIDRPAPDRIVVSLAPGIAGDFWRHPRAYDWVEGFTGSVTVDLQGVPLITSVFAGWLVGLSNVMRPRRVTLIHCSERVREILAVLRLDLLVDIR